MRGRPKKENARQGVIKARVSDEEELIVEKWCEKMGITKSDCLRRAIRTFDLIMKDR